MPRPQFLNPATAGTPLGCARGPSNSPASDTEPVPTSRLSRRPRHRLAHSSGCGVRPRATPPGSVSTDSGHTSRGPVIPHPVPPAGPSVIVDQRSASRLPNDSLPSTAGCTSWLPHPPLVRPPRDPRQFPTDHSQARAATRTCTAPRNLLHLVSHPRGTGRPLLSESDRS